MQALGVHVCKRKQRSQLALCGTAWGSAPCYTQHTSRSCCQTTTHKRYMHNNRLRHLREKPDSSFKKKTNRNTRDAGLQGHTAKSHCVTVSMHAHCRLRAQKGPGRPTNWAGQSTAVCNIWTCPPGCMHYAHRGPQWPQTRAVPAPCNCVAIIAAAGLRHVQL